MIYSFSAALTSAGLCVQSSHAAGSIVTRIADAEPIITIRANYPDPHDSSKCIAHVTFKSVSDLREAKAALYEDLVLLANRVLSSLDVSIYAAMKNCVDKLASACVALSCTDYPTIELEIPVTPNRRIGNDTDEADVIRSEERKECEAYLVQEVKAYSAYQMRPNFMRSAGELQRLLTNDDLKLSAKAMQMVTMAFIGEDPSHRDMQTLISYLDTLKRPADLRRDGPDAFLLKCDRIIASAETAYASKIAAVEKALSGVLMAFISRVIQEMVDVLQTPVQSTLSEPSVNYIDDVRWFITNCLNTGEKITANSACINRLIHLCSATESLENLALMADRVYRVFLRAQEYRICIMRIMDGLADYRNACSILDQKVSEMTTARSASLPVA